MKKKTNPAQKTSTQPKILFQPKNRKNPNNKAWLRSAAWREGEEVNVCKTTTFGLGCLDCFDAAQRPEQPVEVFGGYCFS